MPDLDGALAVLAAEVEAEGGGAYEFFSGLDEMSAGMPEEFKAEFVHHLLSLDNPFLERCALYWLVSGTSLTGEAVAAGLRERLMRGKLEPETLSYLPIIRGWLSASAARAAIDDIGKLALRQGLADVSKQNRAEPIVSDILATTADGVGAQGLTIVGKLQAQTFVAMILLKTGYGIKDAFVIRCRSKREATSIVSYARQEANSVRIDRMSAELLLEAALADGIENGHPPAPAFIDVMEACSLSQLRPQERDLQALLDHVDPQRKSRMRQRHNWIGCSAMSPHWMRLSRSPTAGLKTQEKHAISFGDPARRGLLKKNLGLSRRPTRHLGKAISANRDHSQIG